MPPATQIPKEKTMILLDEARFPGIRTSDLALEHQRH